MRNYSVSKEYHIYTLSDPETLAVRYVGCTMNPKSRYSAHLGEAFSRSKAAWIGSLKVKGLKPIMTVVHIAEDHEEAVRLEREVYNRYDRNLLTCVDPAKHKYANTAAAPRVTHSNSNQVASYFIENIHKLLALNGLTIRRFSRYSNFTEGRIKSILSGNFYLHPDDAHALVRDFNTCQSKVILPGQSFQFDDNENKNLTNRVCKYEYQRTKYKLKPLVRLK